MKSSTVQTPITRFSDLDPEGSYTYADYLLWRFQERVELIRGRLCRMSPAPGLRHQQISLELSRQLANHFLYQSCQVFAAPFDVRLPVGRKKGQETTVVQPDLCVVCDPAKLDEQGCAGAPDLVVEILSPGNSAREMKDKYEVYEESGVREYWIVNPNEREVLVYILQESGRFIVLDPVRAEGALQSHIFPGLKVEVGMVFK
ncbi:MAG: Uma2 family endonuclease [Saprospiraceae bacterium]